MKFIVDFMMGRLCKWLRALGYDTVYFVRPTYRKIKGDNRIYSSTKKNAIIYHALKENRIIITRDHTLSKKRAFKIIFIKHDILEAQIKQVFDELNLEIKPEAIFSRCLICNTPLEEIDKEKIKSGIPTYVFKTQKRFSICPHCQKVYWKGTHWDLIKEKIKELSLNKK